MTYAPFLSVNPYDGQVLGTFRQHDDGQIESALARASLAAQSWRATSVEDRVACVRRLAELLDSERERLGRLMTLEMGKPIQAAIDEAAKCATGCRYYADHGAEFLRDVPVGDEGHSSYVRYDPLGVVLAVMPWNFPFWQVMRFLAPALVAGNAAILKHASNVPQCALALEDIVRQAGIPDGVFQALLIESGRVAGVLGDSRIAAVTLTGSEGAGRSIASTAGKVLKKCVLELGGSDPFIVLPSADFANAVATAVKSRTINNGQSCIAAKRFIVHTDIYQRFSHAFVAGMQDLKVGDPLDPATQLGPLASAGLAAELEEQVAKSVALGARVLCGGKRVSPDSAFFPPTVLSDIPAASPAYSDEFFGPVACLFRAQDLADAIRIANDTRFGLGASVWTNDQDEIAACVRQLDAGSVFINDMVASDARFPFGGVKSSGYGRELGAVGMYEFMNLKTVRRKI